MIPEQRRLTYALLLSLLIHALLFSLTFGGQGLFPGFSFPWQDRRIEALDLRVVVVPAQVTTAEAAVTPGAEPLQPAPVEQLDSRGPALTPFVFRARPPPRTAPASEPAASPKARADPAPEAIPRKSAATRAAPAPAKVPLRADRPADTAPPPTSAPAVIAVEQTDEETWVVPAAPAMPTPDIAAAPSVSSPETNRELRRQPEQLEPVRQDATAPHEPAPDGNAQLEAERQETPRQAADLQEAARAEAARVETARVEAARVEAARVEAARLEVARVEAARVEAARVEAAGLETARVEAARVEAARVEAARLEVARVEAARVEAARAEAARVEAARLEAARVEAARVEAARTEVARVEAARAEAARAEAARVESARLEAARVEAARAEAARVDAARVEAARLEAARVEAAAAQDAAARREATLRAIGRQLDEEAARREVAMAAARLSPPLPPWRSARRYRLLGRTDPNAEVILYAEAWARKIQLNPTFDIVREAVKQPHTDPLVTVAIRSDGSVESVTFVLSSGVAAIDEAIQRVVDSQKPYQVFPPGLAGEFDVIEIRRTWHFDTAIRLQ